MKITKEQLNQIIREETSKILNEADDDPLYSKMAAMYRDWPPKKGSGKFDYPPAKNLNKEEEEEYEAEFPGDL